MEFLSRRGPDVKGRRSWPAILFQNSGPIWVRYAGSKNSLKDQERAVSTVEIL
jgi:hypothetical protein